MLTCSLLGCLLINSTDAGVCMPRLHRLVPRSSTRLAVTPQVKRRYIRFGVICQDTISVELCYRTCPCQKVPLPSQAGKRGGKRSKGSLAPAGEHIARMILNSCHLHTHLQSAVEKIRHQSSWGLQVHLKPPPTRPIERHHKLEAMLPLRTVLLSFQPWLSLSLALGQMSRRSRLDPNDVCFIVFHPALLSGTRLMVLNHVPLDDQKQDDTSHIHE